MRVSTKSITQIILIFWGLWYVFFNASIVLRPGYSILWPVLVIIALLINVNDISKTYCLTRNKSTIRWWVLTIIICFITCIYSEDKSASLEYCMRLLLAFGFACSIAGKKSNYTIFLKIVKLFLAILLICSIIQLASLSTYVGYILPLVSGHDSVIVTSAIRSGEVVGLTNGTSQNGLFMTMGFVIYMTQAILQKDKRVSNSMFALIYFVMTFVSGKRNYALACVVLLVVLISFLYKNRTGRFKLFRGIAVVIVLVGLVSIASSYYEPIANVLNKFDSLSARGDISNGRFALYNLAFTEIKNNLFNGIGVNAASTAIGDAVHSSYIQMLLEFGVMFAWIPLCAIFLPIAYHFSIIKQMMRLENGAHNNINICIGFMFEILYVWSMLFATPFQWSTFTMLFIIMQIFTSALLDEQLYDEYTV